MCTKLALSPGDRVLDVGCGWGSFAIHAAREHDVHVTGITLSEPQAALARERAAAAGVEDRVEFRVADYRDPLEREGFDAVASIGMVEHVGSANIDSYARRLAAALRPGGRLLNHGIARLRHGDPEAGAFSERFVFPDAAPLHLSRIQAALERAGFETQHVEGFGADYAVTLRHWLDRLESRPDEGMRLAGAERMRVWRAVPAGIATRVRAAVHVDLSGAGPAARLKWSRSSPEHRAASAPPPRDASPVSLARAWCWWPAARTGCARSPTSSAARP